MDTSQISSPLLPTSVKQEPSLNASCTDEKDSNLSSELGCIFCNAELVPDEIMYNVKTCTFTVFCRQCRKINPLGKYKIKSPKSHLSGLNKPSSDQQIKRPNEEGVRRSVRKLNQRSSFECSKCHEIFKLRKMWMQHVVWNCGSTLSKK